MQTVSKCTCAKSIQCHVWLFATLWTVAHQPPVSKRFYRQECWSGLLCPSQGDLSDPGVKPALLCFLRWQMCSLPLAPQMDDIKLLRLLSMKVGICFIYLYFPSLSNIAWYGIYSQLMCVNWEKKKSTTHEGPSARSLVGQKLSLNVLWGNE